MTSHGDVPHEKLIKKLSEMEAHIENIWNGRHEDEKKIKEDIANKNKNAGRSGRNFLSHIFSLFK